MTLPRTLTSLIFASLALLARAGAVTQYDITGLGNIWVLDSQDWKTGNPSQKVGCLANNGRFLSNKDSEEEKCGVFTKLKDYPYTISSKAGNCTFNDDRQEKNTDSNYGKMDNAWSCAPDNEVSVYDGLYTIDGFNYPFLCWGDIACYYDAKKIPHKGEKAALWQFRWGSLQRGITPGHVMLQLLWHKVGESARGEGGYKIPGPRVEVKEGLQAPLWGQELKA